MNTNELYNSKLSQFGENDFRSLNWGDKEGKSAKTRYQQMFNEYNWTNKEVLEVGCGWGSFFDFGFTCKDYYGIDINSKLIDIANKKYKSPNINFSIENLLETPSYSKHKFDIAISSGVAGNRQGPSDNQQKLTHYLNYMFNSANTVMINFPSNRATIRTEYVEYFSPEYILGQALNITDNIKLIHKNHFDFLLILTHE